MDIEQEIKAAGADVAPRITPADIEANIASEWYFSALDGVRGVVQTRGPHDVNDGPEPESLTLLTFCVLALKNGFTVTGESACVSLKNFNGEIGRRVARANAVAKMWPLMGYALKQRLHDAEECAKIQFD